MEAAVKILFLGLFGFSYIQSAVIPVQKCQITDKKCLVEAVQNLVSYFSDGIPDYGIPVLDPFKMDDVKFNLAGLEFSLTDATMTGMKNVIFDEAEVSLAEKTATYKFHTDATVRGHYAAEGTVLEQPISGEGEIEIELKNLEISIMFIYDFENIDGKDHAKIKKYKFDFDVKEKANYDLTNLFNGNKELSDAALKFGNENWHQFALTFGRPLIDVVAKQTVKNINRLFKNVPLEDLVYI